MVLYVLRSPESKKHVFSGWSVCVSVCLCVCESVITLTQKLITAECPNWVFRMRVIWERYPKLFMFIALKLRLQRHTKEFQYITAYGEFLFEVHYVIVILHLMLRNSIESLIFTK